MLQLYLLGKPDAYDLREQRIPLSSSLITLLAYVWLHRDQPLSRAQLAGTFWPESPEENARRNLRQSLHQLRKALQSTDGEYDDCLLLDRATVQFNPEAACWVDVAQFESRLERARNRGDDRRGRLLQEAVSLYRGRFLAGIYDDWALAEADRLQERFVAVLSDLVSFHADRREYEQAVRYARMATAEHPLDEEIHRQLMALYYALGDRNAALQQYRECERHVADEVGAALEAATQELAAQIENETDPDDVLKVVAFPQALVPDHNLPAPSTSFVGRGDEIRTIQRTLEDARLVTLTGVGGSGKTRLAREAASQLVERYPDGVRWIDLASVENPERLASEVASVAGVRERSGCSIPGALADAFREASTLWVWDNAEHLLETSAELIGALLIACPRLRFLVTSREPLAIDGEVLLTVPPMASPDPETESTIEDLRQNDAVRLFCERAQTRIPDFQLTPENQGWVAEICRLTDGLPLAIELAATQMNVLSPERIARNLSEPSRLLRLSRRAIIPRHRTLRAALEWSYGLLSDAEQALLRRLSIFRSGWTLEGAEAVAGGTPVASDEVFITLTRLVEKSLIEVQSANGPNAEPRYRLLETVRGFAQEKLRASGERETIADRHLEFVRRLAERAEDELNGADQQAWLAKLAREHGNVRAALDRALNRRPETALRVAVALRKFWMVRGHWREGGEILQEAIERATDAPEQVRAAALRWHGVFLQLQGDYQQACEQLEAGLALYRDLKAPDGMADTLTTLGNVVSRQGNYEEARAFFQEALSNRQASGDRAGMAIPLSNLGIIAYFQGDLDDARKFYRESADVFREVGDRERLAKLLNNLGIVAEEQADHAEALRLFEESLETRRALGDKQGVAQSLNNLGRSMYLQGRLNDARQLLEESLTIRRQLGEKAGVASSSLHLADVLRAEGDIRGAHRRFVACLQQASAIGDRRIAVDAVEGLAKLHAAADRAEWAAQLFGCAEAMREDLSASLLPTERDDHDHHVSLLRTALGERVWGDAWRKGRAMAVDEVIERESVR